MLLKKNLAFRYLFLGRNLNVFADAVMFFSLLKWLEIQSGSSDSFTFFYVAFYLPITLLAFPVGSWIGNKTLQKVMSYSNIIQASVLISFLVIIPFLAYQWVYVLLICISIVALFFVPASQSLLPHLVDGVERPKANSLFQLGYTVVKISGQIFTATMIKLGASPTTLLLVSAVLLLLAVVCIAKIKPLIKLDGGGKQRHLKLMKDGISYVANHPQIRSLFLILALAMFFVSSVDLLLISVLNDILEVGVEHLSYIGAASLCGVTIGAILVPKFYHKVEKKWLMVPAVFMVGISIGSLFFISHWAFIPPFFFLQGIALGCFNVAFVTYLQDVVSTENYTRTFSLYHMISSSMALPGILLSGMLLKSIGVLSTVLLFSVVLLLIGLIGVIITPNLGKGLAKQKEVA